VRKSSKSKVNAVAVVALLGSLWLLVTLSTTTVMRSCIAEAGSADCSPSHLMHKAPYCILDPICVSPTYQWSSSNFSPQWQGSTTNLRDPSLGGHSGYRAFSILNFIIFLLIVSTFIILFLLVPIKLAKPGAVLLLVWCLLEWLRWSVSITILTSQYANHYPYWTTPLTYAGLLLSGLPLALSSVLHNRVNHDHSIRHIASV
jgi:hypothetical protein